LIIADFGVLFGEGALGATLLTEGLVKNKQKNITRRDFIKKYGKLLAGAYLTTPILSDIARLAAHENKQDK